MSRSPQAIQTALAHLNANQSEQAKTVLRRIVQKDPRDVEALKLLAMLHAGLGENDQALFYIRRAVEAGPREPLLRFIHGNILLIFKKDADAVEAYRQCSLLAPGYFDAYDGMGKCLLRMGKHSEAVAAYEQGLAANPDDPACYRMYAATLSIMSRVDDALAVLFRGVARLPQDAGLRESLCYQANFAEHADAAVLSEEHKALGTLLQRYNAPAGAPHLNNSPDSERMLRVGFVSGDFCNHACALFMEGPIGALDRRQIEPYCYYVKAEVEEPTRRFQVISHWRACHGLSPAQLRDQIIADGIDVLIDTAGWTEHHRLGAFTPRAAPVQMTWLGYPNTTGVPEIDYRIVDAITDPPGAERFCTEKLLRLPGCFVSFRPPREAPEVRLSAALEGQGSTTGPAPITFGSFNRLSKVGPKAARTWAKIVAAVPESRLFLKSSLVSDDVKERYHRIFEDEGVTADRVLWSSFVPGIENHLAAYHTVDIALDSYPYNGTTTTCEATWMGVPVVTLRGDSHRARVGASLLTALGLPGLIAETPEQYAQIAVGLASDWPALTELHRTLRTRMAASRLCDAVGFARRLEGAIRTAWRDWCAGKGG